MKPAFLVWIGLLSVLLLLESPLSAQNPTDSSAAARGLSIADSAAEEPHVESPMSSPKTEETQTHSPQKAALYSTLLPGWGQIYNKKYWKAPVAWALIGTPIGFAVYNQQQYREFSDAYLAAVDSDPSTQNPYEGLYSPEQLITLQTTYRRWRDLSVILAATAYALNILDAYVDGHLYYFDISDDLSMRIEPTALFTEGAPGAQAGFKISVSLK
jgi:hypothetical protein